MAAIVVGFLALVLGLGVLGLLTGGLGWVVCRLLNMDQDWGERIGVGFVTLFSLVLVIAISGGLGSALLPALKPALRQFTASHTTTLPPIERSPDLAYYEFVVQMKNHDRFIVQGTHYVREDDTLQIKDAGLNIAVFTTHWSQVASIQKNPLAPQ